jgi:hypothetical protein
MNVPGWRSEKVTVGVPVAVAFFDISTVELSMTRFTTVPAGMPVPTTVCPATTEPNALAFDKYGEPVVTVTVAMSVPKAAAEESAVVPLVVQGMPVLRTVP